MTGSDIKNCQLGNCDIDFLNFCHCQVWNFEILNLFKWNWTYAVIFRKYQKQNRKPTMYIANEWKQNIKPLKFHEISTIDNVNSPVITEDRIINDNLFEQFDKLIGKVSSHERFNGDRDVFGVLRLR